MINFKNLYAGYNQTKIIKNLSFAVSTCQITAIIGPMEQESLQYSKAFLICATFIAVILILKTKISHHYQLMI